MQKNKTGLACKEASCPFTNNPPQTAPSSRGFAVDAWSNSYAMPNTSTPPSYGGDIPAESPVWLSTVFALTTHSDEELCLVRRCSPLNYVSSDKPTPRYWLCDALSLPPFASPLQLAPVPTALQYHSSPDESADLGAYNLILVGEGEDNSAAELQDTPVSGNVSDPDCGSFAEEADSGDGFSRNGSRVFTS